MILLCFLAVNGNAESITDHEKLDQVRSNIDAVKKRLQQITLQQSRLSDQLAEIENRYGETAASLRDLKKQVDLKYRKLKGIGQDIKNYRDQIDRHGKELSGHIRAAYVMGRQEKLKLILNQQDPALSSRMMIYHSYLNKIRLKELTDFEDSIRQLDQLNQQQKKEAELLEVDLEHKKQEQSTLDHFRVQRNELLKHLANDFSSNEQRLSQLIESEAKLKSLIDRLQVEEENFVSESADQSEEFIEYKADSSDTGEHSTKNDRPLPTIDFSELKGKLPWPVKGKIVARVSSEQIAAIRDGVLIDAGEGTEIQAVTSGKVVYSEWLRGYGLLMIIDHGNGYMTLYAFNQSLYKRAGDWVQEGDVIASVGLSGGRSRSGLYFGIRKDGKPVDPLEWCQKSNRG